MKQKYNICGNENNFDLNGKEIKNLQILNDRISFNS